MLYFVAGIIFWARRVKCRRNPLSCTYYALVLFCTLLYYSTISIIAQTSPKEERPLLGFQAPAQKAVHSTRARLRYSYTGHRRPPPPKTTLVAVTMLVVGLVSFEPLHLFTYAGCSLQSCSHLLLLISWSGVWFWIGEGILNSMYTM